MRFSKKLLISGIGAVVVAAGAGAGAAFATGGDSSNPLAVDGYHACLLPDHSDALKRGAVWPNDDAHPMVCHDGSQLVVWPSDQGLAAAKKSLQDQLDALSAKVAQKQDVPASVTASTSVTNWAETSGWADDAFVRTVTVTRGDAAPNSKCGGAATCWAYSFKLTDTGTFLAKDGAKSPADSSVTITGAPTGTMQGSAEGTFYSSSNAPDATLVPSSVDSRGDLSTTAWPGQMFPAGTTHGFALTTYEWDYTDAAHCQSWKDGINPGDDGQNPAVDGNITGVSACATS